MCTFIADSQLEKLKEEWPFLFLQPWLATHFQLLTGETLDRAIVDWKAGHAKTTLLFLTSSASTLNEDSNIQNIAEKSKWEEAGQSENVQVLLILKMLSNYFNEYAAWNTFLISKEVRNA